MRTTLLPTTTLAATLALALLLATPACGNDGSTSPGPDAATATPDPDFADSAARIDIGLRDFGPGAGGDLTITARLLDTAPPWPYDVEPPDGPCRYSTRLPMTCAPCDYDQACIDGLCVDAPIARSAGPLTVTDGTVTRTVPFADATYQHYEATQPFAVGAALTASAPGDDLGAFTLAATVPPPLVLIDRDQLHLQIGQPLVLRWTPADPGARVRLTMGADLGHAQHRAALIECDVPDDAGAITVPQAMIDRLADAANWSCGDCFPHELRRYHRARTTIDAVPLDLWVSQTDSLYLVPER